MTAAEPGQSVPILVVNLALPSASAPAGRAVGSIARAQADHRRIVVERWEASLLAKRALP
jgi:hypothetical protein